MRAREKESGRECNMNVMCLQVCQDVRMLENNGVAANIKWNSKIDTGIHTVRTQTILLITQIIVK